ncbi:MAG: hypothetical protein GXP08_11600 [Gammaproteobacteria bacterium]|nr:hypothetical protein [Gammaproteobacteria bacterium]
MSIFVREDINRQRLPLIIDIQPALRFTRLIGTAPAHERPLPSYCIPLFEDDEQRIKADLIDVLEQVEAWQPEGDGVVVKPIELTEKERDEALAFLKQPDLLKRSNRT